MRNRTADILRPPKYRKVAQCGAKSNRFQSQAVNRVFRRIAAGTTKVDSKKHLKTIGRIGARMSLLTPTALLSPLKVRGKGTRAG